MVIDAPSLTEASRAALAQLRAPGSLHWTAAYLLILTAYIYSTELHAGRYRAVAAGLAVWLADWINEFINSGILAWTGVSALWTETGTTIYQITVGLNAESTALFAIAGLYYARLLPEDRGLRILGMNNRLFIALAVSVFSVAVEVVLVQAGIFHWHWVFWNTPYGLPVIVVFGYLWFFLAAAWAHDAPSVAGAFGRVGALAATAITLGVVFGLAGWL